MKSKQQLDALLTKLVELNVTDVIFSVGRMPDCRVANTLIDYKINEELTAEDTFNIANWLTMERGIDWQVFQPMEISYEIEDAGRFRASIYKVRGQLRIVMRIIPSKIRTFKELNLPEKTFTNIGNLTSGLVLLTGKNRQGKTTSLSSIVQYINEHRPGHIITLESPIEYVYEEYQCLISQCEVDEDIKDYKTALRAALRQSPDVIVVGEIRDGETFDLALMAAETGQLVLSTMHTTDVQTTFDRILNYYPPQEKGSICNRLSHSLQTVITQRLLPRAKDRDSEDLFDMIPALEIFHMTPGIRQSINSSSHQENKLGDILSYIEKEGEHYGMQSFDMHISQLYKQGLIDDETVRVNATDSNKVFTDLRYERGSKVS